MAAAPRDAGLAGPGFITRLLAAAAAAAGQPALLSRRRGEWGLRRWPAVVAEIDRLAAGLRALGFGPDAVAVLDGEITDRLLLAAAAIRAIGGRIRAIPPGTGPEALATFLDDPAVRLVVGQGRETVAAWSEAAQGRIPVIFDHATPDGRAPGEDVVMHETLLTLGDPEGWALGIGSHPPVPAEEVLWAEETTDWAAGPDTLLDAWLGGATSLALPELLDGAARDRRDIQPARWIVSAPRLAAVSDVWAARLPDAGGLAGFLVSRSLERPGPLWSAPLRLLLRERLGLTRLRTVEVHGGEARGTAAGELLDRLGIAVTGPGLPGRAPKPPRPRRLSPAERGAEA